MSIYLKSDILKCIPKSYLRLSFFADRHLRHRSDRSLPHTNRGARHKSESCEIDDWVLFNIDFLTFKLDALRDKMQGMLY